MSDSKHNLVNQQQRDDKAIACLRQELEDAASTIIEAFAGAPGDFPRD